MPYLVAIRSAETPWGTKYIGDRRRRRDRPPRRRRRSPWARGSSLSTPPPMAGLALAGHDLGRRHVGGFEARGAEAVDLHARDASRHSPPSPMAARGRCRRPARRSASTQPSTMSSTRCVSSLLRSRTACRAVTARRTGVTSNAALPGLAALAARRANGVVDDMRRSWLLSFFAPLPIQMGRCPEGAEGS
jgi:hypothetical protein